MPTTLQAITRIIHAIGGADFPSVAACALCDLTSFKLATIIHHPRGATPALLFDNFDPADGLGLRNYLSTTHRLNPVLKRHALSGAVRARDYKTSPPSDLQIAPFVRRTTQEELGFITVGWPEGMEELGLYFESGGGVVEFCIYRERSRRPAAQETLQALASMCEPIAAAFNRHHALTSRHSIAARLSPRETQVVDLMLLGHSSEAIALTLRLSRHTVKDYRKQIFRRLGISSLAELFALSRQPPLRRGIPPVPHNVSSSN